MKPDGDLTLAATGFGEVYALLVASSNNPFRVARLRR